MTPRLLPYLACAGLLACGSDPSTTASASGTSTGGGSATSTGEPVVPGTSTGTPTTSGGTVGATGTEGTAGSTTGTTGDDTTSTGDDTTSTGDESTSTGDDTTGSPIDCAALPVGPLPFTVKDGPAASEDLAFDHEGNLIGVQDGNLFKTPYDGPPVLWVPAVGGFVAGLRMTSNGVLVGADNNSATIFRVNPGNNFKEMVLGGLEYANGIEVDLDGFLYAAEQSGSRVRRIDPATGEFTVVAEGIGSANGLSFSPDYKTLYVGSFGGGTITAIKMADDMKTGTPEPFVGLVGGGALDGMVVDACGNVYVCEFGPAIVWKITPDGLSVTQHIQFMGYTGWIPNMQFGSGVGGWEKETLYVLDFSQNRVFEVPMGIGDKPRGYP